MEPAVKAPHLPLPQLAAAPLQLPMQAVPGGRQQWGRNQRILLGFLPAIWLRRCKICRQQRVRMTEMPSMDMKIMKVDKERSMSFSTAEQFLGIQQLHPFQWEIAQAALDGKDSCVYMATGTGKSLCFQLPAVVSGKVVLVVSPLIALMKEQVEKFNERAKQQGSKMKACFLGSGHEDVERRFQMDEAAVRGDFNLVYITPEKLTQCSHLLLRLRPLVEKGRVALLAVDEAHSISEWGGEFRPSYREISFFREDFPEVPIMALTAIKTPDVKDDINNYLQLRGPKVAVGSAYRPNLVLKRSQPRGLKRDLERIADEVCREGDRAIIYVKRRKEAEEVGAKLKEFLKFSDVTVGIYHAKRDQRQRDAAHDDFSDEGDHIMVATVAYGLGIDFPNIRRVYHLAAPALVEQYFQQIGRAGRDGKPAVCELIASDSDFVKPHRSPVQLEVWEKKSFECMRNLIYSPECLWSTLLKYMGEETFGSRCGNCDVCRAQEKLYDATCAAEVFFEAVDLFVTRHKPESMTNILALICNKKSFQNRFKGQEEQKLAVALAEKCKGMGLLAQTKITAFYKGLVPLLVNDGYLRRRPMSCGPWHTRRHYEVYLLTSKGSKVLHADCEVRLQIPPCLHDVLPAA
ncbi:unnamed protein product [Cladocopium goreaui]|uniref:ATP-dependent DNA helicase n=1 Tax=Cladocopium goreaui TaxID=2562237 RepID=A0A9P1DFV1_9DINO|nr:unnamed protein product [Cladocopium goreaui]